MGMLGQLRVARRAAEKGERMRRSTTLIALLGCLALAACKKSDEPKPTEANAVKAADPAKAADPKPTDPPPAKADDVTSKIGVTAGGIQHDPSEGPAAVVTAATGTVEVRRVGEPSFAALKAEDKLYSGDTVRTAEASSATIALADESVIEVAEVSTVGVGSRAGTADPASSAAVLSGLARFTVTPRAPGEGAFRVYTPGGVVLTRGTTYGVGVAASGEARVGVESGKVDLIGLAALDAQPVVLEAHNAAVLDAGGTVGGAAPWPQDDWGTWRDDSDAKLEAPAAIDAHASALAELDTQLQDTYVDLAATADGVATFEASAAASADKGDTAAYEASLPDGAATIDASFALGGRAEALTWAYAGHATLASDIYVRHPADVEAKWTVIAPRVDAAVLWPKRYELTAVAYLEPLRTQYYVHHPRGRVHAELVGVTVPAFYAKVEPLEVDPVRVRTHTKMRIWIAPEMTYRVSTRPIWIAAPAVSWRATAHVQAAPPRARVAWYVRPPSLHSKIVLGSKLQGTYTSRLRVTAPEPRASFVAAWKVPVGIRVKVGAPDLSAAASARARIKLDPGGRVVVRDHRAAAVNVKGKLEVHAPVVNPKVHVEVRDHRDAAVKAGANVQSDAHAAVKVKVQAPAVKIKVKPPEVKAKVKVQGGIHIGG
jgi:hypothetical protein